MILKALECFDINSYFHITVENLFFELLDDGGLLNGQVKQQNKSERLKALPPPTLKWRQRKCEQSYPHILPFSPYSPSKAIWMAYLAGLTTAGIMDHDSVSGAGSLSRQAKLWA